MAEPKRIKKRVNGKPEKQNSGALGGKERKRTKSEER
jgi:hypothetical protein